tara:strand:- start:507 stop:1163 length:657 start_codon:yes stop_codon:yes gene_type:complete
MIGLNFGLNKKRKPKIKLNNKIKKKSPLDFGIKKAKRSKLLNKNVIKKTKLDSKRINKYSGLTQKEQFILEKTCLNKINKNFTCICKKKSNHFPKICSSTNGNLTLTNCGVSLNNYKKYVKNNEIDPIVIKNKEEQINCILHNLEKNKVKHLDMCTDGKNLCVSKFGILSLIDFNIASINNECTTNQIRIRLESYGNNNDSYNKYMKNRIIETIKNTM